MCFGTVKLCYLCSKGVRGNLSAGPSCLHHEQLLCMKEGLLFQFHGSGGERKHASGYLDKFCEVLKDGKGCSGRVGGPVGWDSISGSEHRLLSAAISCREAGC